MLDVIGPFIASVVSQTQPVFSATLATLIGLEPFRWSTVAGVQPGGAAASAS